MRMKTKNKLILITILTLILLSLSVSARKTSFTNMQIVIDSTNNPNKLILDDIDQDSYLDILVVGSASSSYDVSWYENSGNNIDYTKHLITNWTYNQCYTPVNPLVADLDKDGYKDVILSCSQNDTVAWFKNNGDNTFTYNKIISSFDDPGNSEVIDFDKDGFNDIVIATGGATGDLFWYENDGSESFTPHTIYNPSTGWFIQSRVLDIDGDGDLDVISSHLSDDRIWKHVNNGAMSFTTSIISTACYSTGISVGRLDSDNDTDFVSTCDVTGTGNDKIMFFINNGTGTFTSNQITGLYFPFAPQIVDIDYDNDNDVVSASSWDYVQWFENSDGSGTSWVIHYVRGELTDIADVKLADIDNDGDYDMFAPSAYTNDKIVFLENIPEEQTRLKDWNMTYYDIWDDFSYSDSFVNHGSTFPWIYSNGACGATTEPNHPLSSPFGSYAFAYRNTSGCGFGYTRLIQQNTSYPLTGNLVLVYNYSWVNDTTVLNAPFSVTVWEDKVGSGTSMVFSSTVSYPVDGVKSFADGEGCIIDRTTNELGYSGFFIAEINITSGKYSWWVNGTASNCYKNDMYDFSNIGALKLAMSIDNGETFEAYGDDVGLGNGWVKTVDCYDQDDENYYAKSYVTYLGTKYYDSCSGDSVQEKICSGDVQSTTSFDCTTVAMYCNDGACKTTASNVTLPVLNGDGTMANPYKISTCAELELIANNLTSVFNITADIDCSGYDYGDGKGFFPIYNFSGYLMGNNYTISNLNIGRPLVNMVGLFGDVYNAIILDVRLTTAIVNGNNDVGILVGYAENTYIENCISGGIVNANNEVGGLVGYMTGTLLSCISSATANGANMTGGLIGLADSVDILNSHTTDFVISTGQYVGGLVGYLDTPSFIDNSYSIGAVSTTFLDPASLVGGLIGYDYDCLINNSYSYSSVTGGHQVGGLVGGLWNNRVTNSFATGNVIGKHWIGGLIGMVDGANSMVDRSFALGNVDGSQDDVGGLIGWTGTKVDSCYAEGDVSGQGAVGGLIGGNEGDLLGTIGNVTNCYATGNVYGNFSVGGLIGISHEGNKLINSYSTGNVVGIDSPTGGLVGHTNSTIINSYTTGTVAGSGLVGGLIGRVFDSGSVSNAWWYNSLSSCCGDGTCTYCVKAPSASAFYTITQSVYVNQEPYWDFVSVWSNSTNTLNYPPLQYQIGGTVCYDSDGGFNYYTKGYVSLGSIIYDYCSNSTTLQEQFCIDSSTGASLSVTCPTYCYSGVCTAVNQMPAISSIYSFRNESGYLPIGKHQPRYTTKDRVWWNVTTTDWENNDIYVAIDCDIHDGIGATAWNGVNILQTRNCTYSSLGQKTSRVYVTDTGRLSDYSNTMDDTFNVTECLYYFECQSGYYCSDAGSCYLPTNVTNCTDSDDINYNVSGYVEIPYQPLIYDYCYSAVTVQEAYCSGGPSGYAYTALNCLSYGLNWACYNGSCTNGSVTLPVTLNVRDYDNYNYISGVGYQFYTTPYGNLMASGTVPSTGVATVSVPLGFNYDVYINDSSFTYKQWEERDWVPTGVINAYIEKFTTGDTLYTENWYADTIFHHGWRGDNYTTNYDTTYGFNLMMTTDQTGGIYTFFRRPTKSVQFFEYEITLSDAPPAYGQKAFIYLTTLNQGNILVLQYLIDDIGLVHFYYFDTTWKEVPLTFGLVPVDRPTKGRITFDAKTSIANIELDLEATDTWVATTSGIQLSSLIVPCISEMGDCLETFQGLEFSTQASSSNHSIFIGPMSVTQSGSTIPGEEEAIEGTVTNPSSSDLSSPWYTGNDGQLHFDKTKCGGWNSYIGCALWKYGTNKMALGVAWIFTGTHLLFFIIALILLIIIGPLIIELIKVFKN